MKRGRWMESDLIASWNFQEAKRSECLNRYLGLACVCLSIRKVNLSIRFQPQSIFHDRLVGGEVILAQRWQQ